MLFLVCMSYIVSVWLCRKGMWLFVLPNIFKGAAFYNCRSLGPLNCKFKVQFLLGIYLLDKKNIMIIQNEPCISRMMLHHMLNKTKKMSIILLYIQQHNLSYKLLTAAFLKLVKKICKNKNIHLFPNYVKKYLCIYISQSCISI